MRALASYTRGWELLGHFFTMTRAALFAHFKVSLVLGASGAIAWTLLELPSGALRSLVLGASDALADGRTLRYLAQQLVARGAALVLLAASLGLVAVLVRGWMTFHTKHLRGIQLAKREISVPARAFVLGLLASLALHTWLYVEALPSFPDRIHALLASEFTSVANWLSLSGEGVVGFYKTPEPGWYRNHEVAGLFAITPASVTIHILMTLLRTGLILGVSSALGRRLNEQLAQGTAPVWQIAGIPIPDHHATKHFLFCGSPGSGKSTAIKAMLDDVRRAGKRAIVYDLSGEYVQLFFREGRDKLLNPMDTRSEIWSPWADATGPIEYTMLANSLFPFSQTQTPFWPKSSAILFSATLNALAEQGAEKNSELYKSVTQLPVKEYKELLAGTEAQRFLSGEGELPNSVLAYMISALGAWSVLPDPAPPKRPAFSIRDFVANTDSDAWLFLSTSELQASMLKPLISLWCDIASIAILELPQVHQTEMFFVLDEVASLQRLPALPGLLERGRKHGASVVLGLQALSQLEVAYGREMARSLMSQPQIWTVLRSAEPETAKWLSQALGDAEQRSTKTSYSMGANSERDGVNLSESTSRKPVALPSEIMSLPDLNGFLRLPGAAVIHRIAYSYVRRERLADPFRRRDLLAEAKSKGSSARGVIEEAAALTGPNAQPQLRASRSLNSDGLSAYED